MHIRVVAAAVAVSLLTACSGSTVTRAPMERSARLAAPAEIPRHKASLAHRVPRKGRVSLEARVPREGEVPHEGGAVGVASYYNATGLTAAHRSLPLGTKVRVTNTANGRSVVVRINDRGPFIRGRSIDVSRSAAAAVGMTETGVAKVRMEVLQ
jgi:rare lipoprotein A